MPATLLRKGLTYAIEEFIYKFCDSGRAEDKEKLDISFQYQNIPELSKEITINLYRMIQEIVHNAGKHSNAATMKVILLERKALLYIYCKDDGIGISSPETSLPKNGIGLESLQNRAEMLGGKLQFKNNKGTEYFIEIPLTD